MNAEKIILGEKIGRNWKKLVNIKKMKLLKGGMCEKRPTRSYFSIEVRQKCEGGGQKRIVTPVGMVNFQETTEGVGRKQDFGFAY